jgi:chaperone required for assembly of F1-ATPase
MKRLYEKAETTDTQEGFTVTLDGKPIKTPGRWPLVLPTRALADAIAEEWRSQGGAVRPETMPLMQLAATVSDHIAPQRDTVMALTLRFAETDAVCYRADGPPSLVKLQSATWDPLLDWLSQGHGARLVVTSGIVPISQPRDALDRLAETMAAMDDWRLCAFQAAAASSGSFVIALALIQGRIDADEAFAASELDASFEIERWGEDAESTARRVRVASDLTAARRFHDLLVG